MTRDDRLIVRFQAKHFDPVAARRLWHELIDYAIERLDADSFSAQMDLLDESLPAQARQARDSLVGHTRLQRPRRSFLGLKPPRWPLEPATRKWIEDAAPWIYRLTIWKGKAWVLESELWGRFFTLVMRPEEWTRLQTEKPWLASLEPAPESEAFRKEEEHVRRGWALSRSVRAFVALVAAIVYAALYGSDQGWESISGALIMGGLAYLWLPARDPGPLARLVAQTRLPTDPRFERRVERTLGLGVTGALLGAFAIPFALIVADPGLYGAWRSGGWPSLGGLRALYRRSDCLVDVQVPTEGASVSSTVTPST
jgi:hypothetical protein